MGTADVVVLGGGPGGYAAALRAAARGLSVTLVEVDAVGGTCLHWGCIPSKALLHVGEVLDLAREADRFGLDLQVGAVDAERVNAFRERVQTALHKGLVGVLKAQRVRVVEGHGEVVDDRTIRVAGQHESGRHLVLATGSRVRGLPGVEVDGRVVITSDEASRLPRVPGRALVVGAGAVGLEFASLYRSLGAEVTVVEALERIAPLEDADVSAQLAKTFRRRGIEVHAPARVDDVKVAGDTATVAFTADGEAHEAEVDTVLVAVGRAPRTDGIGLEALGVLDEDGYVATDGHCRTAVDGVWAVGDLLAPPALALAHAGFTEGFLVADAIAGVDRAAGGLTGPIDYAHIPRVTYTAPEVASVGLTEAGARAAGHDVETATYSLRGNAKGLIARSDGFVKTVGARGGEILGVHMIGPHATDLIAEAQLATAWGALPSEVAALVHPHPTLAEALGEVQLAAAGTPFHKHPG